MTWRLAHSGHRPRMVILVSKYDHCLVDLLYRHQSGELAVRHSSHHLQPSGQSADRRLLRYPLRYRSRSQGKQARSRAENPQAARASTSPTSSCSPATCRFLSNEFIAEYPQRIINIHHSFLPAFVGAKPYHQAFTRGVKLIGATSHYVTEVLDDGPIIEQDVVRISHRDTVDDLIAEGPRPGKSRPLPRRALAHREPGAALREQDRGFRLSQRIPTFRQLYFHRLRQ